MAAAIEPWLDLRGPPPPRRFAVVDCGSSSTTHWNAAASPEHRGWLIVVPGKRDSALRVHIRRALNDHMSSLGFTSPRLAESVRLAPEIVRRNPGRGRIAFGETLVGSDLQRATCHERLKTFSQRRTRSRSTILFFIGIIESDREEVDLLLERLGIRSPTGGGHVLVVPIAPPVKNVQQRRASEKRQVR